MKVDSLVLGAGIVGTSVALHLAMRGRAVALLDRRGPGEETSYGNAGIVERASLYPVSMPRDLKSLLRVVLKREPGANYHWRALPGLAGWLAAFRRESSPERLEAYARLMHPLIDAGVAEHQRLAALAGAERLFRDTGWLKVYRTERSLESERGGFPLAREFGLRFAELSREEALALEPHLMPSFGAAVLWSDPQTVSSPGGVTQAYAACLDRLGGRLLTGDARSLRQDGTGWVAESANGPVTAQDCVIALGPWSMDVLAPLGYRIPLCGEAGLSPALPRRWRGDAVAAGPR